MRVALHDADNSGRRKKRGKPYPNLALMKLSAWHKAHGDSVGWFIPLQDYDVVYSSKVFVFTEDDPYLPTNAIKGGTGYRCYESLPDKIEHLCPDYSLYGQEYSMGFTTRGCLRNCPWCIVPQKEGKIRAHADVEEFVRHKDVVLLDNNPLAHEHGIQQMEKLVRLGVRVDYNQGLDARLIDDAVAHLLAALRWTKYIRLACDTTSMMPIIKRAVTRLRNAGYAREIFCYCLIQDTDEALERIEFLRNIGVTPFAQPYRDLEKNVDISDVARALARWTNHKAIFKSVSFHDYQKKAAPYLSEQGVLL